MSEKTRRANTEFIEDMFKLLDKYYIEKTKSIPTSELEELAKDWENKGWNECAKDLQELLEDKPNE